MTLDPSHGSEHSETHRGGRRSRCGSSPRCDGCQLTLLNCEDELIPLAGAVEIAYFPEATRAVVEGPYDVSLVEGSITTPEELERIQHVREVSRRLVTIGACATAGGIQALRNFGDVAEFRSIVYAHPEYLATLARSTPISAHVAVDFELRGCPIDKHQLLEVLAAVDPGPQAADPDLQRVRGVQAARHRLRHGGPRHARASARSPRPAAARSARLRPRLLRLLRPPGHPQHGVDREPAQRARAWPSARGGADLPHLQRGVRAVPARRASGTSRPRRRSTRR